MKLDCVLFSKNLLKYHDLLVSWYSLQKVINVDFENNSLFDFIVICGVQWPPGDVSMTFELISNRLRAFIPLYGVKRRSVRCLQYFHFVTKQKSRRLNGQIISQSQRTAMPVAILFFYLFVLFVFHLIIYLSFYFIIFFPQRLRDFGHTESWWPCVCTILSGWHSFVSNNGHFRNFNDNMSISAHHYTDVFIYYHHSTDFDLKEMYRLNFKSGWLATFVCHRVNLLLLFI